MNDTQVSYLSELATPPSSLRVETKKHILIADDNQANLLIAKTILERDSYCVSCVSNGAEAIDAIKSRAQSCAAGNARPFDIILMDILMPVMDGMKALRRIKDLPESIKVPPIIAFTAYSRLEDQNRYRMAGFDAVIAKPLKHGDVEKALSKVSIPVSVRPHSARIVKPANTLTFGHIQLLDDDIIMQLRHAAKPADLYTIQATFWQDVKRIGVDISDHLPAALSQDIYALSDLRKDIHGLKGISASIGLLRTAHIARRLRNAPPEQISPLIMALWETLILSRSPLNSALTNQSYAVVQQSGANVQTG